MQLALRAHCCSCKRQNYNAVVMESFSSTVRNHGLECVSKMPKTIVCCKKPAGDEV